MTPAAIVCAIASATLGRGGAVGAGARRTPQCWQNAKPAGVNFAHDGQVTLPVPLETSACTPVVGVTTGAAAPPVPVARFESVVPHCLQKFMPAGFTVPHDGHVTADA